MGLYSVINFFVQVYGNLEGIIGIIAYAIRKNSPTVADYCENWLKTQAVHIRATTLADYTSKIKRYIIGPLGDHRIAEITLDDIQMALIPVSKLSVSVYKCVTVLYKCVKSLFSSLILYPTQNPLC